MVLEIYFEYFRVFSFILSFPFSEEEDDDSRNRESRPTEKTSFPFPFRFELFETACVLFVLFFFALHNFDPVIMDAIAIDSIGTAIESIALPKHSTSSRISFANES